MDAVLRQSKAMCPFLKKSSPATLRALSTAVRPPPASPCGGTMSKLQLLGQRCPVMGKALAVQSARFGRAPLPTSAAAVARLSTVTGGRAKLHTSRFKEARAVDGPLYHAREKGR